MSRNLARLALAVALTLLAAPPQVAGQNAGTTLYLPIALRPVPDMLLDYAAPPVPNLLDAASFRAWLPGSSTPLRGAVVYTPGYGMDARDFAQDPTWRAIARQWQFALVGVDFQGPFAFDGYFDARSGSGAVLLGALSHFATASGRPEVANLPLALLGFSAGAYYTVTFAGWQPARVIGFVARSGAEGSFDGPALQVPGAIIVGDSTDDPIDRPNSIGFFQQQRAKGAQIALVHEWGTAHCLCYAPQYALDLFAQIIPDRLPPGQTPIGGPVALRPYAESSGWLGDPSTTSGNWATIASYPSYSGDPAAASWFPNHVLAAAWRAYSARSPSLQLDQPPDFTLVAQDQPLAFQVGNYGFRNLSAISVTDDDMEIGAAAGAPYADVAGPPALGVHILIATASSSGGAQTTSFPASVIADPATSAATPQHLTWTSSAEPGRPSRVGRKSFDHASHAS